MKNKNLYIILTFIIIQLILGCHSFNGVEVDGKALKIANQILDNPELIYNLDSIFRKSVNPEFLFKKMLDSNHINETYNFILEHNLKASHFNNISTPFYLYQDSSNLSNGEKKYLNQQREEQLKYIKKQMFRQDISLNNIIEFNINNHSYGVVFIFYKVDDNIFICYIGKSIIG